MNRAMKRLSLLLVAVICFSAQPRPARAEITDDEIRTILQDRIERAKRSVGIVVGLIDDKGARVITFGKPSVEGKQVLDGNSVFEIGSVTNSKMSG
jgi:D-alanyl-D-alanine-carboxypeptidase/D-alanyl-D-alanine-endopeptidase